MSKMLMANSGLLVLNVFLLLLFGIRNWDKPSTTCEYQPYSNLPCASMCTPVCVNQDPECFTKCYSTCTEQQETVRPAELGDWIMMNAIQHVGITTSDLQRSVAFYTDVLGGVEVNYAGGNNWKGDRVYQLLMQQALLGGPSTAQWAANLSSAGPDELNARYVSFGSIVIEFLDYTASEAQLQRHMAAGKKSFPTFSNSTVAPSVAGNMHVSFNIRTSKNLDEFVTTLEAKAHAKGYMNVWCNRLVEVDSHADYQDLPLSDNAYYVTSGNFEGWSLAYCKGPDGEQLEFNQVTDKAKKEFNQALSQYVDLGKNTIW